MRNIEEEIDAARAKVAHCRIRAERPGSRLEDDFALEKARNRLLTLELRLLKLEQGQAPKKATGGAARQGNGRGAAFQEMRTKREQKAGTARERAEEAFSRLRKPEADKRGAA